MNQTDMRTAVVTGASSGIGEATAIRLAHEGFHVVLGARRAEKLQAVAERCGGRALELDVTKQDSVAAFAAEIPRCDVLVNNAGLALGLEPVAGLRAEDMERMWKTNVMGLVWVTQAFLPKLRAADCGHIVNLGSIAGREAYVGGGGYTASKHAVRVLTQTLRLELVGEPIRITEVAPGLVQTEFSLVRFGGEQDKATKPYEGLDPLSADDIADCIAWAVTRPPHVNVDEIVIKPVAQAASHSIARR